MKHDGLGASSMSRRSVLRNATLVGVAPLAGGLLAACGGDSKNDKGTGAGGTTELRVGYLPWVGNVAPWLEEAKKQFEAKHKGVTVSLVKLPEAPGGEFLQRMTLEARKGEASHDVLLGYDTFGVGGALAKSKATADITELVNSKFKSRMPESVLREITGTDGKITAFPFWLDAVGFLYNKKLLAAAGGQAPTSWEQLATTLPAIKAKLPADTFAYGADWNRMTRLFLPILVTMTDKPYAANGTVDMTQSAALDALKLLKQLVGVMPPSSNKALGSAEVFQAGKLVMESYWQAQYFRTKAAGKVAETDIGVGANLKGTHDRTVFWSSPAYFPAAGKNTELAFDFVVDTFLGDTTAEQSISKAGRFLPLDGYQDKYPEWMRPIYQQVIDGQPLPFNDAYANLEGTTFQQEVELMVLKDQSPEQTQQNLAKAFGAYQA